MWQYSGLPEQCQRHYCLSKCTDMFVIEICMPRLGAINVLRPWTLPSRPAADMYNAELLGIGPVK